MPQQKLKSLNKKNEKRKFNNKRPIKKKENCKTKKKKTKTQAQKVKCTRKLSAILTRMLFLLHTVIAIWRVSLAWDLDYIYFVSIGAFMLVMEMIYTLAVRGGMETKWVCPAVFFYLLSVIPCLWLLEMKEIGEVTRSDPLCSNLTKNGKNSVETLQNDSYILLTRYKRLTSTNNTQITKLSLNKNDNSTINQKNKNKREQLTFTTSTSPFDQKTTSEKSNKTKGGALGHQLESTLKGTVNALKNTADDVVKQAEQFLIEIDRLGSQNWKLAIHQTLLFVLVLGRWLLPNGEITRGELSQLLLVFIGVGADILEFVTETVDEDHAHDCNYVLIYFLYGVWSLSLFQFTLVMTASKSRKTRVGFENEGSTKISRANNCCAKSIFNSAEVWGILVTLLLQDIPFLVFRLYMMIVYREIQQMIIFFTGKNALVVILQLYRIIVLKFEKNKPKKDTVPEEELIPLRGVLQDLSKETGHAPKYIHENFVSGASFKTKTTGDIVIKMTLSGNSLRKNRPNSSKISAKTKPKLDQTLKDSSINRKSTKNSVSSNKFMKDGKKRLSDIKQITTSQTLGRPSKIVSNKINNPNARPLSAESIPIKDFLANKNKSGPGDYLSSTLPR